MQSSNASAADQVKNVSEESGKGLRQMMHDSNMLTPQQLDERKLIYADLDNYKALNAYRELRTNLLKKSKGRNFVCMVTGATQGSGTSHVAMNLAASIALDPSKTALVIDCNIYAPSLQRYLPQHPQLGLTNFLEKDTDSISDIIYSPGIPRVRAIPVGSNVINAAENFSSERMENFIQSVKERYPDRFIILDTPPIGQYAESQILASICDLALIVVGYGRCNLAQVQSGAELIGKEKLAGLVFNN